MSKKMMLQKTISILDGAEFRKQRHAANKTLKEVAKAAGVSISYLCDIELGRREVKGAVAKRLAGALE